MLTVDLILYKVYHQISHDLFRFVKLFNNHYYLKMEDNHKVKHTLLHHKTKYHIFHYNLL